MVMGTVVTCRLSWQVSPTALWEAVRAGHGPVGAGGPAAVSLHCPGAWSAPGGPFLCECSLWIPHSPGGGRFHGGVVVKVHGWMEVPMPGWMGLLPHMGLETPDNEEMESMVRGRMGLMLWWDGGPDLCSCGGAAL